MRRRRATVATPGEWQCAVANGPNIFQMLLVFSVNRGEKHSNKTMVGQDNNALETATL